MSMAHGVEVRVFSDKRIIDFSALISPRLGISHRNKHLLKSLLKLCSENIFLIANKDSHRFE